MDRSHFNRLRLFRTALAGTGLGAFFIASYLVATPASFSFVAPNPGWVPVTINGDPIGDIPNDTPGARDIVGDSANPMMFIAADATHIYFRLRVDADPLQSATNFGPFGWGCFIDTDGVLSTYEYSSVIDGVNNPDQINFFQNTVTTQPNQPTDPPNLPAVSTVNAPLTAAVGHAQVSLAPSTFSGDADYFIDWAVERSAAEAAGYFPGQPASFYCGSSNNGTNVDADCSGSDACLLTPKFSDPLTCNETGCVACGNGIVEAGEGCDDANLLDGDGCTAQCLIEIGFTCTASAGCESAFCDAANNTCACDENADCEVGQQCNLLTNPNSCFVPGCGNGVLDAGEGCDDNNLLDGDGCNSVCLLELGQACITNNACASALCDPAGNICACDAPADCPGLQLCNVIAAPNVCVDPGCGNNVLEPGEACEDGNLVAGDGCNAACLRELGQPCALLDECASGFCDAAGNICACDETADCAAGQQCNLATDPNICVAAGCGNGVLTMAEGCDDGNTLNGDGCNASCLIELSFPCAGVSGDCASGFCDPADNACACDMDADCPAGLLCDVAPAPNACVLELCGDGSIDGTEECDDLDVQGGDGCSASCTVEEGWECVGEPSVCTPAPCVDDNDCELCNEQFEVCVQPCDQDSDCPMDFFCDEQFGLCVPLCDEPSDCPGSICERGSGECVECVDDDDCSTNQVCSDDNTCGPVCDSDDDCPTGLVCDEPIGICVECIVDADCEGELSCIDGQCLPGCTEEADCDGVPCNESTGICVECESDPDCTEGVCDEPVNQCVECVVDADCPTGVCDEPVNQCVECVVDADCPEGGTCDDTGTCVPVGGCVVDADCEGNLVCEIASGECVECLQNEDCPSNLCSDATNTCKECDEDADCTAGNVCELATGSCIVLVNPSGDVYVEGGGLLGCSAGPSEGSSSAPLVGLLGLLGLAVARARRGRESAG